MESILNSIKKLIGGISPDDTSFDTDIIIHINTALQALTQIGVGPETGFSISDASTEWSELLDDNLLLEPVKTYVYLKVKLVFDPPSSSVVMEAMKESLKEAEVRLNIAIENAASQN